MAEKSIVLNASPLILLCNGELDFILPEMFADIVVPQAVWQEILDGPQADRAMHMLPTLDWLKQREITPSPSIIRWDLGAGETAVLSFAMEYPTHTPVLDDILAKKCARALNISTLGTGSILILAKERGLIQSVEDALRHLQSIGLWISEPVIQLLKQKAGE